MRDPSILVDALVTKLKRRAVVGSFSCAIETLFVLRAVVSFSRWPTVKVLLALVRDVGRKLVEAQPTELSVGNAVRRVLHLIKEDYTAWIMEDPSVPAQYKRQQSGASMSMYNLLGDSSMNTVDYSLPASNNMKTAFIQAINELIDEIESIYHNIANQAIEHIHSNEIIMTIGKSKTVEEFLRAAHRKRKFQVIVAEAAPWYTGHEFVVSLAKAGIEATLITDSAIFAVMSRVNKVILGTHAVLANGGLIAACGSQLVAAAAKHHHVPVVVCTGLYKLSTLQPSDEDLFNLLVRPDPVLPFEDESMERADVINPYFDYVAPELISLYITNAGGHAPSYIYRLLSEQYDPEDFRLQNNDFINSTTAIADQLDYDVLFRRKRTPSKSSTPNLVSPSFTEETEI